MTQRRDRSEQINQLQNGSFDVVIIGAGVVEAALFASLSARGVSVAYVSPRDFGAQPNQETPTLVNDAVSMLGRSTTANSALLSRSMQKLLGDTVGADLKTYRSLIRAADRDSLLRSSRKVVSRSLFSQSAKPKLIRQSHLKSAEPQLRTGGFAGAIDYEVVHIPQWPGRLAMNFIAEAFSFAKSESVAANYLKVMSAERSPAGVWELELKDSLRGDCIPLIAKVVINSYNPEVASIPELSFSEMPTALVRSTNIVLPNFFVFDPDLGERDQPSYLQIANSANRRVVLHRSEDRIIATSTTLCDGAPRRFSEVDDDEVRAILGKINAAFKTDDLRDDLTLQDVQSRWVSHSIVKAQTKHPKNLTDVSGLRAREQIEVDATQALVNLVGARIANSHYLCGEIEKTVERMGIALKKASDSSDLDEPTTNSAWYEKKPRNRDLLRAYFAEAAVEVIAEAMHKRELEVDPAALAQSLWQRHKQGAFAVIEIIEQTPTLLHPVADYYDLIWAELAVMRDQEMITCLADFMSRRSSLQQILGGVDSPLVDEEKLAKALRLKTAEPSA